MFAKSDFPGLSHALQPHARDAANMGLVLTHYTSGARHPANGTRLFVAPNEDCNHFRGDHIAHLKSLAEVRAFLAGYKLGRESQNLRLSC